jgi:tRNA uridine 5-carboxymethylaminomethyl modification enzyme
MPGFERAHITRPGYAIEYDFFDPRGLHPSLETRFIGGLFFAGQINGTTGYEEAAAQGLLAGLNAALKAGDREAWHPGRDQAYIGVMVDDLITMGTREPYRMFTSRAEHRLSLREDNADLRLTEKGRELGLVTDERWRRFCAKREAIEAGAAWLDSTRVHPRSPEALALAPVLGGDLGRDCLLRDLLKRPGVGVADLLALEPERRLPPEVAEQLEIEARYSGYIERQREEIERNRRHETTALPTDFDYSSVSGLSNEIKQKLAQSMPDSLGRASRIPGVTPAAISLLLITLKKRGLLDKRIA